MDTLNLDANLKLSKQADLYYGGAWVPPVEGSYEQTLNPGTGQPIGMVATASRADVDRAVAEALKGFHEWRDVFRLHRGRNCCPLLHGRV